MAEKTDHDLLKSVVGHVEDLCNLDSAYSGTCTSAEEIGRSKGHLDAYRAIQKIVGRAYCRQLSRELTESEPWMADARRACGTDALTAESQRRMAEEADLGL